jgi:hypothetical protein
MHENERNNFNSRKNCSRQGKIALVDDEDFEWLSQWKWRYMKAKNTGYATRSGLLEKKTILMHRIIMNIPDGYEVDHFDHDGCNNQKYNLRNCTHIENLENQGKHKNNTSGYKGIWWDERNQKWGVQIRIKGKRLFLGRFDTPEIAAHEYDKAARQYLGEYAQLNFQEPNGYQSPEMAPEL